MSETAIAGHELPHTPAGDQMRWHLWVMNADVGQVSFAEYDSHFHPDLLATWPQETDEQRLENVRFRKQANGTFDRILDVNFDGQFDIRVEVGTSKGKRWRFGFVVESEPPHRIVEYPRWERIVQGVDVEVVGCKDVSRQQRALMRDVFSTTYRRADLAYLEEQVPYFDCVSMATIEGEPAGFVFFGSREAELPGLGLTNMVMGGLSCVKPEFRRMGVWDAMRFDPRIQTFLIPPREMKGMSVGRMAHPGSFRGFSGLSGLTPAIGKAITPWQQDVGAGVALAFDIENFDPPTFVCRGRGRPLGEAFVNVEVSAEEWERFQNVDRSRGDTLLAIGFWPNPPDGWGTR
jgi:hypothetical protein